MGHERRGTTYRTNQAGRQYEFWIACLPGACGGGSAISRSVSPAPGGLARGARAGGGEVRAGMRLWLTLYIERSESHRHDRGLSAPWVWPDWLRGAGGGGIKLGHEHHDRSAERLNAYLGRCVTSTVVAEAAQLLAPSVVSPWRVCREP
jgi:hypothetical protein